MTTGQYVEYSSNNSGGVWWLDDDQWKALEAAGWEVLWAKDDNFKRRFLDAEGKRYLGALATEARRYGVSLGVAIAEWEDITGERSSDLGCRCCGVPHSFALYDANDMWVDSFYPFVYGEDE